MTAKDKFAAMDKFLQTVPIRAPQERAFARILSKLRKSERAKVAEALEEVNFGVGENIMRSGSFSDFKSAFRGFHQARCCPWGAQQGEVGDMF